MKLLILGGTGFIGRHQVRYALRRGHAVTLFNRGQRSGQVPEGVELLIGDRDGNDYRALEGREFDACIDNATLVPRWVRDVGAVLAGRIGHYTFISTTSVYASDAEIGSDESAAREPYTGADAMAHSPTDVRSDMSLYGPLKALCEDEAHRQFSGITAVIRPGLIVGPGDESDRFTYWTVRIARGCRVLVPPLADPLQFVDVRDVAEWTIRVAEARATGTFNAKGPDYVLTVGAMLETIRRVTGSNAVFREADKAFLDEHQVSAWTDLPVWIPGEGDTAGAHRRDVSRAIRAGLTYRPLADTVAATLDWWQQQPEMRKTTLKLGLSAEREAAVLSALDGAARSA